MSFDEAYFENFIISSSMTLTLTLIIQPLDVFSKLSQAIIIASICNLIIIKPDFFPLNKSLKIQFNVIILISNRKSIKMPSHYKALLSVRTTNDYKQFNY